MRYAARLLVLTAVMGFATILPGVTAQAADAPFDCYVQGSFQNPVQVTEDVLVSTEKTVTVPTERPCWAGTWRTIGH